MAHQMPPTQRGYSPYDVVSALQKAVRRSDPDAALYWGAELFKSGYNAWAWKRLRVIMTEDVGPAMPPGTVADIWALKAFAEEGTRKDRNKGNAVLEFFYFGHALILLCKSPKTRIADNAMMKHLSDHVERREIPDEAHDVHTAKGRAQGRDWTHFVEESGRLIDPDEAARSRGYESMEDELEHLNEEYVEHFLAMNQNRKHELPHNPFSKVTEGTGGKLQAGKDVKTHYVQRPLGIPMPGQPDVSEPADSENEDGEE